MTVAITEATSTVVRSYCSLERVATTVVVESTTQITTSTTLLVLEYEYRTLSTSTIESIVQ
jgi:hypothetical protein